MEGILIALTRGGEAVLVHTNNIGWVCFRNFYRNLCSTCSRQNPLGLTDYMESCKMVLTF